MYDLAFSEHSDLIVSASGDAAGISGIDLIEQRMRFRLMLRRGTWLYDEAKTMGSNLHLVIGMSPEDAENAIGPLVREALRPMDEIVVDDVQIVTADPDAPVTSITLVVLYSLNESAGDIAAGSQLRSISVNVPIGGA
jgi:hypothetical protein